MTRNTFFLEPVGPFRLDLTVWTLRRRPDNIVDRWDGETYRRALSLSVGLVEVVVVQMGPPKSPQLRVTVHGAPLGSEVKHAVTVALERLLGLRIEMAAFYRLALHDPELRPLVQRFRGMKPPRFTSVFESVINAIASQQVSRIMGVRLVNRLAASCGVAFHDGGAAAHTFPLPDDLAASRPVDLQQLGFSRQKGRAMIELAKSITEGGLDLEGLTELPDDEAAEQLRALRGVGSWTAEYVLLRGLARIHVFPGGVVGVRNNLYRWQHLVNPPDDIAVRLTLARWYPYGGLVYFHLLLNRLAEAGFLGNSIAKLVV